ncbi:thioredoxin domain-containing protein [Streptomyces sp. BR123]|nr:thioredoxin domain-containing protein [Streptomyces sp. BR123]
MNDGANRQAKRSARERLQAERERERKKDKRRRTLVVATAVVGVLALAAVVGLIAANAGKGDKDTAGPVTAPAGAAGKDALAIPTGRSEAKSTLTVWEDFRCPACKSFEVNYKDTIHELEAKGLLKGEYHLVTLIDGNMGGSGSLKSANAAACAQDAGKFTEYHDLLFQNQPEETDDAYGSNAKLIELAGKVEGLDTPAFRECVEKGTHNSWVAKSHEAFRAGNFRGTPTIQLNGKDIFADQANPITPQKLKEQVEAAAKGTATTGGGKASASPSASASSGSSASASPGSRAKGTGTGAGTGTGTGAGTGAGTGTGTGAGTGAGSGTGGSRTGASSAEATGRAGQG